MTNPHSFFILPFSALFSPVALDKDENTSYITITGHTV